MDLNKDILNELAKPFPANKISIKVQTKPNEKGNSLCVAYIDARDVMDRLDAVVAGEWSDVYRSAPSGGLECALTVCGVTRCDVGDDGNDNEKEKSGYSDAFKRAAVKFGVGRFLYDLPKMYGKVKTVGKNVYLENGEEQRLQKIIEAALKGDAPDPQPKQQTNQKQNADRPIAPETLRSFLASKSKKYDEKKVIVSQADRQIVAAVLDTTFQGQKTKRYELCKWLVGTASTKEMTQATIKALQDWLECHEFNDAPPQYVIQEANSAHTTALKENGQMELVS